MFVIISKTFPFQGLYSVFDWNNVFEIPRSVIFPRTKSTLLSWFPVLQKLLRNSFSPYTVCFPIILKGINMDDLVLNRWRWMSAPKPLILSRDREDGEQRGYILEEMMLNREIIEFLSVSSLADFRNIKWFRQYCNNVRIRSSLYFFSFFLY